MKVLVILDAIGVGGVSTAFLNFISVLSENVNCDIFVFDDTTIDKNEIPVNVRILKHSTLFYLLGMPQDKIKEKSKLLATLRLVFIVISKMINGRFAHNILFSFTRKIGVYDVVISYVQDVGWKTLARGCNDFALRKIDAKKKCAFIHCDYEQYGGYAPEQEEMYDGFDYIMSVSEGCKTSFIRCFPKLEQKVVTIENFINEEKIKKLSAQYTIKKKQGINIVTVCRLSPEKGIDRMLRVFSRIVEDYSDFHWTVIGGGEKLDYYLEECNRYNLTGYVSFVGEKKNPYPYLLSADVFLLPSVHEAAPMVFGECAAFKVPVISTNTSSALELVENRNIGYVCDNTDEGLYDIVKKLLCGELDINSLYSINNNDVNHYAKKQLEYALRLLEE